MPDAVFPVGHHDDESDEEQDQAGDELTHARTPLGDGGV
jgi:hypothetical protein